MKLSNRRVYTCMKCSYSAIVLVTGFVLLHTVHTCLCLGTSNSAARTAFTHASLMLSWLHCNYYVHTCMLACVGVCVCTCVMYMYMYMYVHRELIAI